MTMSSTRTRFTSCSRITVDIVVPNVLQRWVSFHPVVYKGQRAEDGHHLVYHDLPKEGLHEVYAAGSAGMLISRRVLEAVGEDPFTRSTHIQNEDLAFCARVREAGFIDRHRPRPADGSYRLDGRLAEMVGYLRLGRHARHRPGQRRR